MIVSRIVEQSSTVPGELSIYTRESVGGGNHRIMAVGSQAASTELYLLSKALRDGDLMLARNCLARAQAIPGRPSLLEDTMAAVARLLGSKLTEPAIKRRIQMALWRGSSETSEPSSSTRNPTGLEEAQNGSASLIPAEAPLVEDARTCEIPDANSSLYSAWSGGSDSGDVRHDGTRSNHRVERNVAGSLECRGMFGTAGDPAATTFTDLNVSPSKARSETALEQDRNLLVLNLIAGFQAATESAEPDAEPDEVDDLTAEFLGQLAESSLGHTGEILL